MYLSKIKEKLNTTPSKEGENEPRNDFDLLVKVMKVVQKDESNFSVRIKDISKDSWNLTLNFLRYQILKEGDIIWIRSASWDKNASSKNLILPPHGNIMKFMNEAKIVTDMQ